MERDTFQKEHGIIGRSVEIREIVETVRQAAPTDITILLTGESGAGKEVFARAIHAASKRSQKPMVSVNCGAIPEGLIESELFGHEKGSFTSAVDTRKGFFEIADGGTLFLDEIGEMPLLTQVKLLRVLENGEYMRVGSSTVRVADVRVIAATNKNLEVEVQQKRFRADLYFRLRSVTVAIPPLRRRREDIPLLVEAFIRGVTEQEGVGFEGFTDDATTLLMQYDWPGNVRELRNVIESVVLLSRGGKAGSDDVLKLLQRPPQPEQDRNLPVVSNKTVEQAERELIYRALLDLKSNIVDLRQMMAEVLAASHKEKKQNGDLRLEGPMTMESMESQLIQRALQRHQGNRRAAARELNISERTLYRRIKELGLEG